MEGGRRFLIAAAVVIAAGLNLAGCGGSGAPAHPRTDFGVNVQGLVGGLSPLPDAQRLRLLSAVSAAGVHSVRVDAFWQFMEGRPPAGGRHVYFWRGYDRLVGELAVRGIRWQPVLNQAPVWASSHPFTGPAGPCWAPPPAPAHFADFAALTGAFAHRYGRGGSFWSDHPALPAEPVERYEIWNEPNNIVRCADGKPVAFPPAQYGRLYRLTRDAIHGADPDATVLAGGLSEADPARYVHLMLAADSSLRGHVDGWGLHPYATVGHTEPPETAFYQQPLDEVVAFRHALEAERVPGDEGIYVTEIGWPTGGSSPFFPIVCDSGCARSRQEGLVRTSDELAGSNCGVANYVVHTWWTPEDRGGDPRSAENWFGIANRDGTLKPSARAWTSEVRRLGGSGSRVASRTHC